MGNTVYFTAFDPDFGGELWKSDGTPSGTTLVKDINPGGGSSNPSSLTVFNGVVYFAANDGVHGAELWGTDGSPEGTFVVKEITAGSAGTLPYELTVAGDLMFFVANMPGNKKELWKTDGTVAGTQSVREVLPVNTSGFGGYWLNLIPIGEMVYFTLDNGSGQNQLWKSDGSVAGTNFLREIETFSSPTVFDGTLFYTDVNQFNVSAIWKSDGTAQGTVLLKPGVFGGMGTTVVFHDELFFWGLINGVWSLWKTDGTADGTIHVIDISYFGSPVVFKDEIYFNARSSEQQLWKSDGTASGTTVVKVIPDGNVFLQQFTTVSDKLFFSAITNEFGQELWVSDGTESGTRLVSDIADGELSSSPQNLVVLGERIIFQASDNKSGYELWTSDGIEAGTFQVFDIGTTSPFVAFGTIDFKGGLYFLNATSTNMMGLWKTDGSTDGTILVTEMPFVYSNVFTEVVASSNFLYFSLNDGVNGRELWITDGTAAGTNILKDINPGSDDSNPSRLNLKDNMLFFSAYHPMYGQELWRTDGTSDGTMLVKDLTPGAQSSQMSNIATAESSVFFQKEADLWKTNGTEGGTQMVVNLPPSQFNFNELRGVGNTLYFVWIDPAHGAELWKSEGTQGTTGLVKDIDPGNETNVGANFHFISMLGTFKEKILINANDGVHGYELWMSDGTEIGTKLVKDINPGLGTSAVTILHATEDLLYFRADDGTHGSELWVTDGSEAGTRMVADINPGAAGSTGSGGAMLDDHFYFTADDGIHGTELWKTDLTVAGTVIVGDIMEGARSSRPGEIKIINDIVVFTAFDSEVQQLWRFDPAHQEISAEPVSDKLANSAPVVLEAMATSGLPVTFTLISGPATLDGNVLTFTGAGVVTVKISQAGNGEIDPAEDVWVSFSVSKAPQAIDFAAIENKDTDSPPFLLEASSDSGLPVTFELISGPATVAANMLTINGSGEVVVRASQAGNAIYEQAEHVDRSFTIDLVLGIEDHANSVFRVYPNPVFPNQILTIEVVEPHRNYSLELLNANGKRVWEGSNNGASSVSLPANALSKGLHLLRARNANVAVRVIVE